ncbi:MAG: peptidoglycan-binding protein [Bryobacterales bacterium]|nr:peptidoglycan-binding protein [Bryobacterales bacterium]
MRFIQGGVGRGGQNYTEDVRLIQLLLNDYVARSTPYLIAVDGIAGSRTIEAIEQFQRGAGLPATGVVEPAGPTLRFLVMGFITSLAGDLTAAPPEARREHPSDEHVSDALVYLARARGA